MHTTTQRRYAGVIKPGAGDELPANILPDDILNSFENVAIFSVNKKYCYTSFNLSHSQIMKKVWGAEVKLGMNLLHCLSMPEIRKLAKASIDRALQGEAFSEIQFQPGVNFYYEFYWNPVYQNKKVTGVTAFIVNITDRKLADQALHKNEEQLKQGEIFAKFGSWKVDLTNQLVYASEGAQRIYGAFRDTITFEELIRFRLPEYNTMLEEAMRKLITENIPYDVEFKIKRENDGKIIDIHSRAEYDAVTNTVFGTIQDITDRKLAEQAVLKTEAMNSSILNASPDGIVITDLEGRLQLVSPAALRIFHYNHKLEVLGRQLSDFVIPGDRDRIIARIGIIYQQNKSGSGEYTGLRKDGSNFPVEVNTNFIRNEQGEVVNLITIIRDISDRRLAETELATTTKDLKRTAAIAKVGGWEYNFETKKRFWSKETCQILEIDAPMLTEMKDEINFGYYAPEVQPLIEDAVKAGLNNGTSYDLEMPMITAKGKHIWIRDQGSFVRVNGKTVKAEGVIQDITERKRANELLDKEKQRLALIIEGTNTGTWEWNIQTGETIINERWAALIGYTLEELMPVSIKTWEKFTHPDDLKKSDDLIKKHINGELEYYECEIRMRHKNGQWVWILDRGRINSWSGDGKPVYMSGTHQDINSRKQTEALLEDSMVKYQGLSDAAYEAIFISENDLCLEQNKMAEKLFGYTAEEAIGRNGIEWIVPADRPTVIKHVHEGYEEPYEVTALRKDGSTFPCLIRGKQMRYKGRNVRVTSLTDMTEIKVREQKINRQQRFTEVLLHSIPTPVFYKDKDCRYLGCNEAFTNQTGVLPEEIIGKTTLEIWPGEQAVIYNQKDQELLQDPVHQVYESTITDKNGEIRDVLFAKDVFYDELGNIAGIMGAYIDITEKNRIEASKSAVQERIMKIAKLVPGVIYQFRLKPDGSTAFLYASESLYTIFQVRPEDLYADSKFAFSKIHPDDYADFVLSIKKPAEELSSWKHECRVILDNGTVRHIYGSAMPEQESDGSILWHGFITDITDHKFTEERIRQLSKAVEQSPVSIVITDTGGNIQYVNPKFEELTGYTVEEALGNNPRILKSGYTTKEEYKKLWETIKRGETWHGELHNKKKNGDLYWESASISPVINEEGETTHYLAVKEDITERKKAEAEIERMAISLDTAPNAITVHDFDGNFLYTNQRNLDIHGYSKEELMNINLRQLNVPGSEKSLAERVQQLLSSGEINFETTHYRKDGTIIPLEIYARLTSWGDSSAVLCMATDITERLAAEQKIQELLKSYEFVNKATSDTIWEWDMINNTIARNENFEKIFGYKPGHIVNSPQWAGHKIHPDDYKRVKGIIDHAIENKLANWQAEYRYCAANGKYKYVYDRGLLLFDNAGNPLRMYGAMTDLTEKQKLKHELAEQLLKQQKQLLEVNIQAHEEEKSELGKELHDNISQMLATVKMYLGLAKAGRSVPEFNLLDKSYDYVEETISELRKLSHSLVPPSLGEIGLQEALRDLIRMANVANDKSIKLDVDKKIGSGEFDKKTELMIYRIVQEQLNNINKYASAKNVSITIKKAKNSLFLTITDDGVGFDLAQKSKGIGLRNMTNRVEYYSGTLEIITAPGAGCSIHAKIPFDSKN